MYMLKLHRCLTSIFVTCLVAFVYLCPLTAQAGSFALNEQSVSGLGVAYAGGAAQASDVSSLFFNPASIALLKQGEIQLGGQLLMPSATFSNEGSRYKLPNTPFNNLAISGGNGGDGGINHILPNIYVSQPLFRSSQYGDLSVGIGLSVPFGLETDYSPGWVGRYNALRSKLTVFDIQPTIAYRLFDRLTLGGSVDIQYASARLTEAIDFGLAGAGALGPFEQALPALLAARGVPPAAIPAVVNATRQAYNNAGFVPGGRDGISELNGSDWRYGFTLGAIVEYWKGDERECFQDGRIGFSYRSGTNHDIRGRVEFRDVPSVTAAGAPVQFPQPNVFQSIFSDQNAKAGLDLPGIYHFSVYQRFARQFALMGDIAWTRWSRLQSIPITVQNPNTPTEVINLQYTDSVRYSAGFEWYATKCLTFRLGFAYDETPIRGADTRLPQIPDSNKYFISTGLRWSLTRFCDIDVGYAHVFVPDPLVNVTDNFGHNLRGKFDASVDIVGAALTFRWGGAREISTPEPQGKEAVSYRK